MTKIRASFGEGRTDLQVIHPLLTLGVLFRVYFCGSFAVSAIGRARIYPGLNEKKFFPLEAGGSAAREKNGWPYFGNQISSNVKQKELTE